ncbi:hypothetical protein [Polaromonas sp. CG_23.6]|uniref:hypothetical protein n=1 Tax=Polaromonas sp. CG_23.6 TaxID=2760709 RepID=UPI0024766552|nr:hypothetical protein [Polaromonas sp. CG_23.6]MDH6186615.1 hypothetical protein [Polaromonas sp. CG_23.6]
MQTFSGKILHSLMRRLLFSKITPDGLSTGIYKFVTLQNPLIPLGIVFLFKINNLDCFFEPLQDTSEALREPFAGDTGHFCGTSGCWQGGYRKETAHLKGRFLLPEQRHFLLLAELQR